MCSVDVEPPSPFTEEKKPSAEKSSIADSEIPQS
jgi:hypothetical protein